MGLNATINMKTFQNTEQLVEYLKAQEDDVGRIDAIKYEALNYDTARNRLSFERHMNPDGTTGGFFESGKVKLDGAYNFISRSAVLIGNIVLNESVIGENTLICAGSCAVINVYKSRVDGAIAIEDGEASITDSLIYGDALIKWSGGASANGRLLIKGSSIGTPLGSTEISISNVDVSIINSQVESDVSISFSLHGKFNLESSFVPRGARITDYNTLTSRLDSLKSGYEIIPNSRASIREMARPKNGSYRWVKNLIEYESGNGQINDAYYIEISSKDNEEARKLYDDIKERHKTLEEFIEDGISKFSYGDTVSKEILKTVTLLANGVDDEIKYDREWDSYIKSVYIDRRQHVIPFSEIIKSRRGVCHEKALLLEMLIEMENDRRSESDKIISKFVEGTVKVEGNKDGYGHAWVELHLPNGKDVIIDPTNWPYMYGTYADTMLTDQNEKVGYERNDRMNALVIDAQPLS
jgi:hypothetical protein